jgi:hypothetical protein
VHDGIITDLIAICDLILDVKEIAMYLSAWTIFSFVVAFSCLIVFAFVTHRRYQSKQMESFIRTFKFPIGLFAKLREKHPQLTQKDCMLVSRAMRKYFLTYLKSKDFVAMPSQVVDDFWHEFILYTRDYKQFCNQAFGQFMHHTPLVTSGETLLAGQGLRRCWTWACKEETINPMQPLRLPLLFAIDAKLGIENGFNYAEGEELVRQLGFDKKKDGTASSGCGGGGSSSSNANCSDSGGCGDGGGGSSGCGGGGCGS